MKLKDIKILLPLFIIFFAAGVAFMIYDTNNILNAQQSYPDPYLGCYHKSGEANCVDKYFYNGFCFTTNELEVEKSKCSGTFDCGCVTGSESTSLVGPKACNVFSKSVISVPLGGITESINWSDTFLVTDDWGPATCKEYADGLGLNGQYKLVCINDQGFSMGESGGGIPTVDCGWRSVVWEQVFPSKLYSGTPGQSCIDWLKEMNKGNVNPDSLRVAKYIGEEPTVDSIPAGIENASCVYLEGVAGKSFRFGDATKSISGWRPGVYGEGVPYEGVSDPSEYWYYVTEINQ